MAACASSDETDSSSSGSTNSTNSSSSAGGSATTATTTSGPGGSGSSAGGSGGSSGGSGGFGGSGGSGASGGAGGSGGGSNSCQWSMTSNPCGNGFYCDAPSCGMGTCVAVSTTNDTVKTPVCGCDGVSYWNATTAANFGMPVKSMGECMPNFFCGGFGNLACPDPGHSCSRLLSSQNDCNISHAGGQCWGMPKTCSQIGFGGTWRDCYNLTGPCEYECDARKLDTTRFFNDSTCPM